jgi:selenocysteine lyase/cysteine desulfurase
MTTMDEFLDGFSEEPGYLDYARVAPIGRTVLQEQHAMSDVLSHSRFGATESIHQEQDERVRVAVSLLTGFEPDRVVFQPNTSMGLLHAMFGLTGTVALAPSEFPSLTVSAVRAHEAMHALEPLWLETDGGRVTPGNIKRQLKKNTAAVAVSLVDFRTGYLVDLEGIRQVIGDRLLIVDAIQGFGVANVPYTLADVVVSGGQKWVRAGWGTGFMAMSDRALERLTPVLSGFSATEGEPTPLDVVPAPAAGVRAYSVTFADPIAQARLAAALEEVHDVGVGVIRDAVIERTGQIIDVADEFGIPVVSSRNLNERAGIVVVEPDADQLTVLAASLHNHGITATRRQGAIRLSAHASTTDETIAMLRAAFVSFASAVVV